MTSEQKRYIVGIYAAAMCIMGMLVPVPILANIARSFPDANIATVQMCIGIIPLCMALSAMFLSSVLASRVLKRHTALACHILIMVAGLSVVAFHDSLAQVLCASVFVGIGIGGIQNGTDALIADYFEGEQRGSIMGVYSTFVALGGILWTALSGILGHDQWCMAYAAYAAELPFIIVEFVCLPKGHLEPKPKGGNVLKSMPREVALITFISFVFVLCFQLFSTNVSLIVADRGFGGTAESATASTVMTVAGIFAGLLVGPLFRRFKNRSMPLAWCVTIVGLLAALLAPSLAALCAAGFVISLGKETYVPLQGNFAAGNSSNEGRAFNLAIGMAGTNFGMALSPLFFEVATAPFGAQIPQKFVLGIVIIAVLVAFGVVHYKSLTPAQLAEEKAHSAAK
ncbi:major facilitator superfamily MFS_1 [Olsenella uli DSM 7084]|uniref:Major facilitator superfamily MFS_1 n=1 Tax=Olsenella uli (strain ATCC 49627 / DSM 7084 / CCUG 31166 / CIP 109912 / JCM 12494 / LMG 11480 / NCIMB 702895 / VPI D76D-27C) TaxID=633147 RepID=E1QZ29_OLSUV|nr:MFS transporter [Olsenella uli]ADK67643.1 major facilitator superfamily MFS_1 [Olsenella uli DSM 7084]KRO13566.1 major facilitator superfamily protein [Olsenella uli DSM 7084]